MMMMIDGDARWWLMMNVSMILILSCWLLLIFSFILVYSHCHQQWRWILFFRLLMKTIDIVTNTTRINIINITWLLLLLISGPLSLMTIDIMTNTLPCCPGPAVTGQGLEHVALEVPLESVAAWSPEPGERNLQNPEIQKHVIQSMKIM